MRKGTAQKVIKAADLANKVPLDGTAVVPMSLRVSLPMYQRLRKLAFEKHQPMTELMIRGIEMVLKVEKF